MAKFKSVQSGDVYEFLLENDIKTMRSHNEYEEVVEAVEAPKPVKAKPSKE